MAVGTNRWKLGLFVILGTGLAIAALVVFGAQHWNERTVPYFAYFDESVQGLDVGSPVKFKGVEIGSVKSIQLDLGEEPRIPVWIAVDNKTIVARGAGGAPGSPDSMCMTRRPLASTSFDRAVISIT